MSVPVPAVRAIIFDAEGRVLVLRRANTEYLEGAWCLPGGKVEYGETVEEAVRSELREETALECTALRFLFYQDGLPLGPGKMHCVNLYFECRTSGTIVLNRESSEHAWVSRGDLDRYAVVFGGDEALRRYWGEGGG